jgi:hypothetical protein
VGKGLRNSVLAVLVIALIGSLAGCGSGDEDSLTKKEFQQQATVVCHKGEQEREEALSAALQEFEEGEGKSQAKAQEEAVLAVLDSYDRMTSSLADLGAPDGDEEKVEGITTAMEDAAAKVRANPQTATGSGLPFKEPNEMLADYGLKDCQV